MSTPKIVFLDAKTVGDIPELEELKSLGDATLYDYTAPAEVNERISDATIVLTNKVKLGAAQMSQAPNLKLICVTATGTNNVDHAAAAKRGIEIKNVAGYAVETVAQHTFAVLLHLLHQIRFYDDHVKSGDYSRGGSFTNLDRPFVELHAKRMGIIGLGNIGRAVARIAKAGFGMEVVYYSTSGKNVQPDYEQLSLEELLQTSDVVSIHAGLNERTMALIGRKQLTLMRSDAILINMGRGGIVVEKDLAEAIDEEQLGGACIDVFEDEPFDLDHPYLKVQRKDRLVLTPHIAWAAVEARRRLMREVLRGVRGER
ncbi:MAG: D-2-hydroxyacid dehydrogenase [Bacteroidota bacterium]